MPSWVTHSNNAHLVKDGSAETELAASVEQGAVVDCAGKKCGLENAHQSSASQQLAKVSVRKEVHKYIAQATSLIEAVSYLTGTLQMVQMPHPAMRMGITTAGLKRLAATVQGTVMME